MGLEVAKLLLARGWQLGVAARREERLHELELSAPDRVKTLCIDVDAPDAPEKLLRLIALTGGMDLYFHASGIGFQNPTLMQDVEMKTVRTNALGFTQMVGTAFHYLASHGGGQIAAISSIAGTKGLGPAPAYSATKAFQNTYLQALDQQAHQRGLNIAVTDIRPGFVDTDLLSDGHRYPLMMKKERVAKSIVCAVLHRRRVMVTDGRWRLITFFWRCLPNVLWRYLKL